VSTDNGQTFSTLKKISANAGPSSIPQISSPASNDNGQTFSTPDNLSENARLSTNPEISSAGNNVYVVWHDNTPGNYDIFFAVSNDNGQTFSMPKNLSGNAGQSSYPQISSSTDGTNVYVVWHDRTTVSGESDIFFVASNDNGQTFSMPKNLSFSADGSAFPQISSLPNGNSVYVVWEDNTPGNSDIFFAVSNDNGQTFSTPKNLSANADGSDNMQISSAGNNVYVVWQDRILPGISNFEIKFVASNDNGQTFSMPKNLSANAGRSDIPEILTPQGGNNVYVVWKDDTNTPAHFDIFFVASQDNGQTFSMPKNLSANAGVSESPQISSSLEGNNVYVVWRDRTTVSGNYDIFFAASTDNGQTFSTPENLSANVGSSFQPQISSSPDGNNVYVVWEDDTPGNFETFAVSNDNGKIFRTLDNLSESSGDSRQPKISSSPDGNNVYVVWAGQTNTPGNWDIFFVVSTNNG
jgi:predicted neuraminidase